MRVRRISRELNELALGGDGADRFEVAYEAPGKGRIVEAEVVRCKNGLAVNYTEAYMRRRDPKCMVVADERPTDKRRYSEAFSQPFPALRQEIFDWLASQDLLLLAFQAGGMELGVPGLLIAPAERGLFRGRIGQPPDHDPGRPVAATVHAPRVIYLAPPFRHTHCDGRQVVMHHRGSELHESLFVESLSRSECQEGDLRGADQYRRARGLDDAARFHGGGGHALRQYRDDHA